MDKIVYIFLLFKYWN